MRSRCSPVSRHASAGNGPLIVNSTVHVSKESWDFVPKHDGVREHVNELTSFVTRLELTREDITNVVAQQLVVVSRLNI
jgi:hypothetical protein